jgi:hypothetical protein
VRIVSATFLIGLLAGILFLRTGVGSAVSCSDISVHTDLQQTFCQESFNWDDWTQNRYTNNHETEDAWICLALTDDENVASYDYLTSNCDIEVPPETTSYTMTIIAIRDDDCSDETFWKTKATLAGYPVCEDTFEDHLFEESCCE